MRILVSIVGGILSAGLGWLTAALIGTLIMKYVPSLDTLGIGILMALLLYVLACIFGAVGFVLCMALFSKWRGLVPK